MKRIERELVKLRRIQKKKLVFVLLPIFLFVSGYVMGVSIQQYNPSEIWMDPVKIAHYHLSYPCFDITFEDNRVYIAGEIIYIFDVSYQLSPVYLGQFWSNKPQAIAVQNEMLYVADAFSGLKVYNTSNPKNVERTASFYDGEPLTDLKVIDDYAYLSGKGLKIFDISNDTCPLKISEYESTIGFNKVYVENEIAYLVRDYGLDIVDVSDPYNPRGLSKVFDKGSISDIKVCDDFVYLTDIKHGLKVLDVSNPSSPKRLGRFNSKGETTSIAVSDTYAYLSNSEAGIDAIWIGDCNNPLKIGAYKNRGNIENLDINENLAYVIDNENNRFEVIRLWGDSDNDGLPDDWERHYNLDLSANDAEADFDGDNVSNLDEFRNQANPFNIDTDGDNLNDGDEIEQHGSSPYVSDSDGDFYRDGSEIRWNTGITSKWGSPLYIQTSILVGFGFISYICLFILARKFKKTKIPKENLPYLLTSEKTKYPESSLYYANFID